MGVVASGALLTPARLSIPAGRASVSIAAAAFATVSVGFGFTFPSIPRVGVSIASTSFSMSPNHGARAINITTTGFTLIMYTVNGATVTATGVPIDWWAIPA